MANPPPPMVYDSTRRVECTQTIHYLSTTICPGDFDVKQSTADKVGQKPYVGGRNDYLGFGRINAYKALKYVIEHYNATIGGQGVTVTFPENITTTSGTTLTVLSGTTVQFAASKSLTVNGKLVAQGTSANRIRFTSDSPSSKWSGIALVGSGANSSVMDYVDIDAIQTYGGSAMNVYGATGLTFTHSKISNSTNYGTTGIYLSNAGTPEISYDSISSCGDFGVEFYNTNGYFYRNTLSSNSSGGVNCCLASPMFGKVSWNAYYGNNSISGGAYGIYASSYSYPYVGSQNNTSVGFNSITAGSSARVYATGYCNILAENNWWGSSSPSSSWFQALNNSTIDWNPYLYSQPGVGGLANLEPDQQEEKTQNGPAPTSSQYIKEASNHLLSGDLGGARDLFASALKAGPTATEATQSLFGLLRIYSETSDPLIPPLVRSQTPSDNLPGATLYMVLGELSRLQGDVKEAARNFGALAQEEKGTEAGRGALLQLFNLYIVDPATRPLASGVLNSLEGYFGTQNPDVKQARWIQGLLTSPEDGSLSDPGEGTAKTRKVENSSSNSVPATYSLSEGYPNPFNPSTTIDYQLPEPGVVNLAVYDLLGRKVIELANGIHQAGYYSAKWNAASEASGVYYVRFSVVGSNGGQHFTKVNKLLLIK